MVYFSVAQLIALILNSKILHATKRMQVAGREEKLGTIWGTTFKLIEFVGRSTLASSQRHYIIYAIHIMVAVSCEKHAFTSPLTFRTFLQIYSYFVPWPTQCIL